MTTFLRLLEVDQGDKGATLADAAAHWRSGSEPDGIFQVEPSSFEQVPGSPFAYWVSERVRRLFTELPAFEGDGRTVKQGLATADDFRFVRCWWEVDAGSIGERWFPFAKGGAYSPFYADVHLVVNWGEGGREICNFVNPETGRTYSRPQNTDFYFRPGLTFPRRTPFGFCAAVVPRGCIFSHAAQVMFFPCPKDAVEGLSTLNSSLFNGLLHMVAGTSGSPQFEVGMVKAMPWPGDHDTDAVKADIAAAFTLSKTHHCTAQTSLAFMVPAALRPDDERLKGRLAAWSQLLAQNETRLDVIRSDIDDLAYGLYGLDGQDRRQMEGGFGSLGSDEEDADDSEEDDDTDEHVEGADPVALTEALLEWGLGVALGRFDVRLATGERTRPPDPDPFDPLPVCSPGMLQDHDGLPVREAPADYPLELPPHGILVDNPGHPWDVVACMEAAFEQVVEGGAHEWLQEAEGILSRDLRDWLRRYGFERHLKRYSRSRRKAPLFWHLAPKSREYGIWLYSPVATRDTFYRVQNDYVEPKLKAAERRLLELRQIAGDSPTGQQRKDLASQESLVEELRAFREQVALVAPLWKPYRDDGVVLNCAVLSDLFDHHRTWQKECAKKWGELADGKYDWAGWAMHLWPERVVATCASDRSIAIAHGLEEALWQESEDGKWEPRADAEEQVAELVAERRSPAVESALDAYERAG